MHDTLLQDRDRLPEILSEAKAYADVYLAGLDERPVAAPAAGVRLDGDLPEVGQGAQETLREFKRDLDHLLSASPGPRYLGFVTGGATPAALAGDWLASTFDQNAQLNGDTVAADLEQQALRWLGGVLGVSQDHTGIVVTGATMANFTGLAIARQWLGERRGVNVAEDGLQAMPPIHVLSGAAHSSIAKALAMAGLGRRSLVDVPRLEGREAVDVAALEGRLAERRGEPLIVVANAGTVNTGDFDDLAAVAKLKERYEFWLHVDGAFGAFAGASSEYRHFVQGIAHADSITVDGHKWMNVPYDSGYLYTRHLRTQLEVFRNASPYLPVPAPDPRNVLHLGPENSRRWRALPLWFALKAYGAAGVREIVERDCAMARLLGERVGEMPGFQLLAPVRSNIVCFTLRGRPTEEQVLALRERLVAENVAYLSPTSHAGKPALRAAFCNWRTEERHIEELVAVLERAQGSASRE